MTAHVRFTHTVLVALLLTPGFALAQHDRLKHSRTARRSKIGRRQQSAETLMDELLFQRASQTYLWAMPLVNTMGMKVGSEEKFGAGYNVLPIWKKRLSAKTLVTTPNSDVIYAMSYVDLGKDGPLVFDAPPLVQGILLDAWQRPIPGPTLRGQSYLGDVGFFGPDQGKGAKFLLLPPGYNGPIPDGHFVFRSQTNNVIIFLRGVLPGPGRPQPRRENSRGSSRLSAGQGKGGQGHDLPRRLRRAGQHAAAHGRQCVRSAQATRGYANPRASRTPTGSVCSPPLVLKRTSPSSRTQRPAAFSMPRRPRPIR